MKIHGWGEKRDPHCSCRGTKHGMNWAFIRHQRLHLAAQSEGTQTWFPRLCCSLNPLFTLQLTWVCVRANKAAQIFNTSNLSRSNSWNEALPYGASSPQAAPPHLLDICVTPNRPKSCELELIWSCRCCPTAMVGAKGKEGTFLLSLTECVRLSSSSLLRHWFSSRFAEVNLRLLSCSGGTEFIRKGQTDGLTDRQTGCMLPAVSETTLKS